MTKAIRVFLAAGLLVGSAVFCAAQTSVRADVPFDFSVNGKSLHAGTYTISRVHESDPALLVIHGASEQPITFYVGADSPSWKGASLSFQRLGETYYLTSVTSSAGKFRLPLSRAQREAARKEIASEVTLGSR